MEIKPIGFVRNEVKEMRYHDWEEVVSEIVVDEQYAEALDGIEEFSHIIVLFWLHQTEGFSVKVHPKRKEDLPLVGMFATRTPFRPNPVGVSTVKLLERRANVLKVHGLDAIDGTPVLDIKPYLGKRDMPESFTVPEWVEELDSP